MTCLKKIFLISIFSLSSIGTAFSAETAESIRDMALEKDTLYGTLECIFSNMDSVGTISGRRSLWCFAGRLQELSLDWEGAAKAYSEASDMAGENDAGFENYSANELRLMAAKCFLNNGEYKEAEQCLNRISGELKDERLLAKKNLYSLWVGLCRIDYPDEIRDCMDTLKSYLDMDTMKSVRSSVLFTLWYVGGDSRYSDMLKKEFPNGPEYSIVRGKSKLAENPFWYFVPRSVDEPSLHYASASGKENKTSSAPAKKEEKKSTAQPAPAADKKTQASADTKKSEPAASKSKPEETKKTSEPAPVKKVMEQLGLFRKKENADALISRAKEKGFNAYCYTETRASGTTYYIVVVDENADGTMGRKLRAAGFDCYPVE